MNFISNNKPKILLPTNPPVIATLTPAKATAPVDMYVKKWRKVDLSYKQRTHSSATKPTRSMGLCAAAINFVYHRLLTQHRPRHSFNTNALDETSHCCQSFAQLKLKSKSVKCAKLNMYPWPNKCIDDQLVLKIMCQTPSSLHQSCRNCRSSNLIPKKCCTHNDLQNTHKCIVG